MVAGGGYGLAASGALNALEAGGAAASEIQKRIDTAYDKGILQQQPQYQQQRTPDHIQHQHNENSASTTLARTGTLDLEGGADSLW